MKDQGMTYEQMMAMIGQGGENEDLQNQIDMQMRQAEMLRGGAAPRGRQAGNVFVAQHPMEMIGGLAQQYVGQQMQNRAQEGQKQMTANKQAQYASLLKSLSGGGGSPPPAAGPGFAIPRPQSPGSPLSSAEGGTY